MAIKIKMFNILHAEEGSTKEFCIGDMFYADLHLDDSSTVMLNKQWKLSFNEENCCTYLEEHNPEEINFDEWESSKKLPPAFKWSLSDSFVYRDYIKVSGWSLRNIRREV